MPLTYTCLRTARTAAAAAGYAPDADAYALGALGAAPLQAYGWLGVREPAPLYALAGRMQTQDTSTLLTALLTNAKSPLQRAYATGFLQYYTTMCVFGPYLDACEKTLFAGAFARLRCAAALDAAFYATDEGQEDSIPVPAQAAAPALAPAALAAGGTLLAACANRVYGVPVTVEQFVDAYQAYQLYCRKTDKVNSGTKSGVVAGSTRGVPPVTQLPALWENPYTHAQVGKGPHVLALSAAQKGTICIGVAQRVFAGVMAPARAAAIFDNRNMRTGRPCAQGGESAAASAAPKAPTTE